MPKGLGFFIINVREPLYWPFPIAFRPEPGYFLRMTTKQDTPARILVIDDEESIRFILSRGLARAGYEVDTAETLADAGELLNEGGYFLVFLDIVLPDGSGLDLLDTIRKQPGGPYVVVMTAEATMKNAIAAMQKGAFDYITKPFDLDVVNILVERVAEYKTMSEELARLKSGGASAPAKEILVGRSAPMQEMFKLIGRAAGSGATVLITGPTGSGKELVARALHASSGRGAGPFVTVNCAAIPGELLEAELFGHVKGAFTGATEDRQGKFAAARGGTLLLDEIGDMPMALQAKMLRVLQEKEFYPVGSPKPVVSDARVLASTNQNLSGAVAEGRFREDLYHRLDVVRIQTPPLAERKADIPLLVEHFLEKIAASLNESPKKVGPGVVEALMGHDWPGSVRELENVVRRAVIMAPGDTITLNDIPAQMGGAGAAADAPESLRRAALEIARSAPEGQIYDTVIRQVEKALIENALAQAGGVRTKAARALGLNRNTLQKKIEELGAGGEEA